MSSSLLSLVAILIALLYLKWVLIVLTLPLMALAVPHQQPQHKGSLWWKLMAAPNHVIEKLMRGGWQRYVLFQVAALPSVHLRQVVYRMLGAQVGERVVFHVGTEIRGITNLVVGGGASLVTSPCSMRAKACGSGAMSI